MEGGTLPFGELEAKQAAMWGSEPYERVEATPAGMHADLVGVGTRR